MGACSGLSLIAFRAVLFDFGDTLVSLRPSREEIFEAAAATLGIEVSLSGVERAYQIVDFGRKYSSIRMTTEAERQAYYRDYNQKLCEALGLSSHLERLVPVLGAAFAAHKEWHLRDGAVEVLRVLHEAGCPLGVVANWDRGLPRLVENLGLADFFEFVIGSQEAGTEKPEPDIFRLALARLPPSLAPVDVAYVGNDYALDVVGARSAGLTPILIDAGGQYPHADCLRFASLREWLATWQGAGSDPP